MLQKIIKEAYAMMFKGIRPKANNKYIIHGSYLKIGVMKLKTTINIKNKEKNLGKVKLIFLEQNPKKDSKFGKAARKGAKIMWIIMEIYKKKIWLGRVENDKWIKGN